MAQDLQEVEIFSVGTWNGMKFNEEDLQEIAANTEKLLSEGKHKPPLKLGHSSNQILKGQSDGDPAMGWIENIRVKAGKLVADFKKVPGILINAFKEGLYRQVSVEMRHIDHTGWILTGVALLGADLPAVKSLNDLEAFLSEKFNADTSVDIGPAICFSTTEPIFQEDKTMSENKELEEMRAELEAVKAEKAKFQALEAERQFSDKKADFLAPYKKDVKEGKLAPAVFSDIEKEIDSKKADFSEHSEIRISGELLHKVTRAYAEALPQGETAHSNVESKVSMSDSIRIDEKIENEIAKVQANGITDYFSARDLVFKANPELDKEYKEFTLKISRGEE